MNITCYLIVNERGSVRVSKQRPSLKWDEVPVCIRLSLPESLFQRPWLEATVEVPEGAASIEIPTELQQGVAEAIADQAGVRVKLEVVSPEPETED